jgi:hypothetical protein
MRIPGGSKLCLTSTLSLALWCLACEQLLGPGTVGPPGGRGAGGAAGATGGAGGQAGETGGGGQGGGPGQGMGGAPGGAGGGSGGQAGSVAPADAGGPAGRGGAGAGGSGGSGGRADAATGGTDLVARDASATVDTAPAGPGPGAGAECDYPADAPTTIDTKFDVGTVVPNLVFTREDGSQVSLKDIRCNKKNRLLVWLVGGDNCPPCVSQAKAQEIPAWQALGTEGLFILESFNGKGFLVSRNPFASWRQKTTWPADGEGIALVREPTMAPWYVVGRVANAIPWRVMIDLQTMKVITRSGSLGVDSLRMRLGQLPPRQ